MKTVVVLPAAETVVVVRAVVVRAVVVRAVVVRAVVLPTAGTRVAGAGTEVVGKGVAVMMSSAADRRHCPCTLNRTDSSLLPRSKSRFALDRDYRPKAKTRNRTLAGP